MKDEKVENLNTCTQNTWSSRYIIGSVEGQRFVVTRGNLLNDDYYQNNKYVWVHTFLFLSTISPLEITIRRDGEVGSNLAGEVAGEEAGEDCLGRHSCFFWLIFCFDFLSLPPRPRSAGDSACGDGTGEF